ncbi:hypothetical protein CKO25_10870 [Thiocapsa imhoffii]|uniref:Uncharacterized protein n=1 Tax=Thiocapsa imhoffii TaxID=382777 RepID=A0A9X0WJ03_9GAMM|nr:hypothetical protein [Thiocapsa imhoffii]
MPPAFRRCLAGALAVMERHAFLVGRRPGVFRNPWLRVLRWPRLRALDATLVGRCRDARATTDLESRGGPVNPGSNIVSPCRDER